MRTLSVMTLCLAAATITSAYDVPAVGLRGQHNSDEANKARALANGENGLEGYEFLAGIRDIIKTDPQVSPADVQRKPFMGSFTTISSESDPAIASTSYCMTDNPCGNPMAYVTSFIPLVALRCNNFCYIDKNSKTFHRSSVYTTSNPPPSYLCCAWAEC